MSRVLLPLLISASITLLCGCSTTQPPGEEINRVLQQMAKDHKELQVDAFLAHYAEDFESSGAFAELGYRDLSAGVEVDRQSSRLDRRAYGTLLQRYFGSFKRIAKAKYVLDDLVELDDGAWKVRSLLLLYAWRTDGTLHHETTNLELVFVPGEQEGTWRIREQRVLSRTASSGKRPHFVQRAAAVGLGLENQPHSEITETTPVIPGNFSGSGASAGDLDGDGDLDLVVGDGVHSRVFRNKGDGTFEDITARTGLGKVGKVRGAFLFDADNDGRLDILFTRAGPPPVLFRNVNGEQFEDATNALGELPKGQYESAAFADLDGDGDLDVFLVRYGDFHKSSWAYPIYNATDGEPDVVLENKGDGTFTQVHNPALTPPGWGLAVAIADYDDDGDQDIYIVNDFGVNHLLRNEGSWRFTDVTERAGVTDQGFGMSAAFGDYDGDGDLDIYVANMNSGARWVFQDPEFPLPMIADLFFRELVKAEMHKVTRGNSLFQNQGDGTFKQMADVMGVERAQWAWGANFVDYDNDGDLDIYCPNGYITGAQEPDQ